MKRPFSKMPQDEPSTLSGTKGHPTASDRFVVGVRPGAKLSRKATPPAGKPTSSPDRFLRHQDRLGGGRTAMPTDAATERARLLREAVCKALAETRHRSIHAPGRNRIIKDIAAAYNGRALTGGRRLRLSLSNFKKFLGLVRQGRKLKRNGRWEFLVQHYRRGPREKVIRGPAPVDVKRKLAFVANLPGQHQARTWNEVRKALILTACMEIAAQERSFGRCGRSGRVAACKMASKEYWGADLGDGKKLGFSPSVAYRSYMKCRAEEQLASERYEALHWRQALRVPPGLSIRGEEQLKLN